MQFTGNIIFFTNKSIFVHHIELLAGGELFPTNDTSKTFQMEHFVPGPPDQVIGGDSLATTRTLGSKSPVKKNLMLGTFILSATTV